MRCWLRKHVLFVGLVIGCGGSDSENPSTISITEDNNQIDIQVNSTKKHIGLNQATNVFPSQLLKYEFKSIKQKAKSDVWIEYSSTYKYKDKKLKVVINEYLPNGNPEWQTLFSQLGKRQTKGYDAAFNRKNGKSSWMVIVGKRFRVDFKSSDIGEETLRKIAKDFNFSLLERAIQ